MAYQDRGYFKATISEPTTHVRDAGGLNRSPSGPRRASASTSLMPVEEGERYQPGRHHLHRQQGGNEHQGPARPVRHERRRLVQCHRSPQRPGKPAQSLRQLRLHQLRRPTPCPRFDEAKKTIYLDIDIDEGKPFYVSRIEFTGNTITRDKVIRRELLLEEGQVYNGNSGS